MKISKIIAAAMLASALAIPLAGCEDEGPFEETGEEIDEAVEEVGDAIEDSTDDN